MAVEILIIRNKCDAATNGTHLIGDGLMAHLQSKGRSVAELSDAAATPENVHHWLNSTNNQTKKLIIGFDHGSCSAFYGEKNNQVVPVITLSNVEDLTKELHVYTFACSTNGSNCIGQTAVSKDCYSWLGYTEPVYVFTVAGALLNKLKTCVWSYIDALVDGKTLEQAEAVLKQAYKNHFQDHWVFKYNHDRLLLRKRMSNTKIDTHNRVVKWWRGRKVTGLYAHGPQNRNAFVHFQGLGWKRLWPAHDAQVVSMMASAAHAKAKNRNVDFFEDDGRVKILYVF